VHTKEKLANAYIIINTKLSKEKKNSAIMMTVNNSLNQIIMAQP